MGSVTYDDADVVVHVTRGRNNIDVILNLIRFALKRYNITQFECNKMITKDLKGDTEFGI